MTARLDVTPKTTEQNRIIRTGKSETEVTNDKKLRSKYCTIEAMKLTTDRHKASRGLFATSELLVTLSLLIRPMATKYNADALSIGASEHVTVSTNCQKKRSGLVQCRSHGVSRPRVSR